MGYRSQLAGCISVDTVRKEDERGSHYFDYDRAKFKEMIGFIKLSRFYELWQINNHSDADSFGWQNGKFILYGSDWKWYPDYEDVQAWNELWENMQDIEGISGYFVRVGEENDDIEEMQFGDDPCYDHFHAFSALQFDGEDYLGKRDTDEAETTKEDTATTQPDCAGANHATETQQREAQA
jgi:hypothetical protein